MKPYAWNLAPRERILLLTARFKVVRPIPIRKDPGKSGLKGTFLLGKRACNKRAIKEKPINGMTNWPTCKRGNFSNKWEIRLDKHPSERTIEVEAEEIK